MAGFALGGFLQNLVLTGTAESPQATIGARALRWVLGGSILLSTALVALAVGVLVAAGSASMVLACAVATVLTLVLAPLALMALSWVDRVLDPNRVLAAYLDRGDSPDKHHGKDLEFALRACLDDASATLLLRTSPEGPWRDVDGEPTTTSPKSFRALAQRTQKSTEEIQTLVAALHSGTKHVAMVMNNSRTMPANGMPLSGPNIFCSSGISSATEARCKPNTPTDMPLSQSTSKVSMVSW